MTWRNWTRLTGKAVQAEDWSDCKESKQAEFLFEESFPWELVRRVGVCSQRVYTRAFGAANAADHRPHIDIVPGWYY